MSGQDLLSDLLTGKQVAERYYRPGVLADFWRGEDLSLGPSLAQGLGAAPRVELLSYPTSGTLGSLAKFRLRIHSGGGGAVAVQMVSEKEEPALEKARALESNDLRGNPREGFYYETTLEARLRPGENVFRFVSWNALGRLRSEVLRAVVEVPTFCGDGQMEGAEACDDGNRRGGDGCGVDCRLEVQALLGGDLMRLSDSSLACLLGDEACRATIRYAKSLGVGIQRYPSHFINQKLSHTLPSSPVVIPKNCRITGFDPARSLVVCAGGCVLQLSPGALKSQGAGEASVQRASSPECLTAGSLTTE